MIRRLSIRYGLFAAFGGIWAASSAFALNFGFRSGLPYDAIIAVGICGFFAACVGAVAGCASGDDEFAGITFAMLVTSPVFGALATAWFLRPIFARSAPLGLFDSVILLSEAWMLISAIALFFGAIGTALFLSLDVAVSRLRQAFRNPRS